MIVYPNAKINLGLNILRRRDDGYHDIETLMVPVGWRDILEIVPAQSGHSSLKVSGRPVDCPPEKNLVMKACRALGAVVEFPAVDIYLHKIIPDGAGLGGGSADAAFTLTCLNELFALGLGKEQLADIASGIGADCPFFIYNRPMMCTGTGTILTPASLPESELAIVIAKPNGTAVSTAEAYAGVTPSEDSPSPAGILSLQPAQWQKAGLKNDFEASVFAKAPATAALKQHFAESGAVYTAMSGSGAAVFGLFENRAAAERAAETVRGNCDVYSDIIKFS